MGERVLKSTARHNLHLCSQLALVIKNPAAKAGEVRDAGSIPGPPAAKAGEVRDAGSIPGSGRPPGGGNGNPLSTPACRILWTERPGGRPPMGSQRVRNTTESMWHVHSKLAV